MWALGSAERRIRRPLALGHRPSGVVAHGLVAKELERQLDAEHIAHGKHNA